jgi:DNA-binding CsgD family transcriptional regulator
MPALVSLLIDVLLERGEVRTAETELIVSGMGGVIPDTLWSSGVLLVRGRLRLAQRRAQQASEDLIELQHRVQRWGMSGSPLVQAGTAAAVALTALGERARARELAESELVHARRWGAPSAISRSLRALGLALDGPRGLVLLEQAVDVLSDSPVRLARAHALAELGAALRRANRRSRARQPLREALDLARRCGATGLAKRTHEELLASGERVRRYTPIGVESLTPSERRVAEMAAAEMTNRQIAQALFVTVKTIETHLAAVYDKLGISSRHELPDALRAGIEEVSAESWGPGSPPR